MGWCTQLLKNSPKPWIGIDGVAAWIGWFIEVYRAWDWSGAADRHPAAGKTITMKPDASVNGGRFFLSPTEPSRLWFFPPKMWTWDFTSDWVPLNPLSWHRNWHICCANFSAWTWKNLAEYVAMNPCWAIYFTTKQWWDPVGFAVIFSSDGELIKN